MVDGSGGENDHQLLRYKGSGTGFADTDTVGAEYNPTAGAAVIADVDSTPASVTAALALISSGSLEGQVPGLALVNAVGTTEAAVTAFEAANKAAADALITKLDVTPAPTTFADKVTAITDAANDARDAVTTAVGGDADTTVLVARAATANTNVNTAFNALTAAEKTAANAFAAAVTKEATAKAAIATVTEKAGVVAAFDADTTADAALAAHTGATTATALYAEYVNATAAQRTAIDSEFAASTTYAAFKAAAVKDAAYADAIKATLTATDALDTNNALANTTAAGFQVGTGNDTINGVTIAFTAGNETTATGSAESNTYLTAAGVKAAADTLVVDAKAADADVAAAKALSDSYAVTTDAADAADAADDADDAAAAIGQFNTANAGVAVITDLGTSTTATAAKDVFYFADKATSVDTGADFTIGTFAAGDSIVVGSGYTFNSGALTTGNNNALELFLVDSDNGVQVVVESSVFGSGASTANASTGVIAANAATTVITLTGVTAAELTVNNGVISHVA